MINNITEKALEDKKKKISYNILAETLKMIDELAEITSCTRTQILDSILAPGIKFQTEYMIKMWKIWAKEKRYQEKTLQKKIKKLIKDTENFNKKWELNEMDTIMKSPTSSSNN